ncbi:hypothetical protein ONZ51_g8407 [Trametes cubensis]|uniref:Uncharacterized protein n=1 Tax=Trametes cubensis TaxID=1111947 RepID=A0AAD7TNA2_9APHY|nr:hypothetical protein ONZ51_g8407 [Trametes cubensis]
MPHKHNPSTGTCEVVPANGELPCAQPGYREHPRLCNAHRKEYGRLTAAYKATSEEAEILYAAVRALERTIKALHAIDDVDDALEIGQKCLDAIEREIRERQDHHRRFFIELHNGHEQWIDSLRKKRVVVEKIISQLRLRHDELLLHGSSWELEQGIYADDWSRENSVEAVSAYPRTRSLNMAKSLGYTPPSSRFTTPSAKSVVLCVANELGDGVYCCTTRALPCGSLCTKHLYEYMANMTRFKRAAERCSGMSGDVRRILAKDIESAYQTSEDIWQDLDVVIRFGGALDQVSRCETESRRFPGMAFKPYERVVDRDAVYGLRNRLEKKHTSPQLLAYNTRHARTTDAQKPCMPTYREKESYTTPPPAPSDAGNGGSFVVFLLAAATAASLGMGVISSVALGGFVAWAF